MTCIMNTRSKTGQSHKMQSTRAGDNNDTEPQPNNGDPPGTNNTDDTTEVTHNLTGRGNFQPDLGGNTDSANNDGAGASDINPTGHEVINVDAVQISLQGTPDEQWLLQRS